ncbi:hypothetical protein [Dyadobacter aurulentus]|uniref:hypothetical protein n=1 Tax=Dyadobacter sp. UC 10 TaxID=2605428 RepID=UPI001CEDC9EF|nr:hypothetical protein [Dyadobacter sp. UC 10]
MEEEYSALLYCGSKLNLTEKQDTMPVHVAIARRVLPGKQEEFKEALRRFLGESFLHRGVKVQE